MCPKLINSLYVSNYQVEKDYLQDIVINAVLMCFAAVIQVH